MKIKNLILSGLLLGSVASADNLKQIVSDIIPGTTVSKVQYAQLNGLLKAYLPNGQILYIEPNQKLIFFGEIWTNDGVSVTALDTQNWQKELRELEESNIIGTDGKDLVKDSLKLTFGTGSNEYKFVMFTNPFCHNCVDLENFLKNHNITVYSNLLHFQGREAYNLAILDSKNPIKTIEDIQTNKFDISKYSPTQKSKQALEKMQQKAQHFNVTFTPKVFVIDKDNKVVSVINGADIQKTKQFIK
ncbi:MAG: thioredoxin fold domain-containing protein [Arcobacteraceae bacterium]|jgi:thiol:disulfide interchange protein DsbC